MDSAYLAAPVTCPECRHLFTDLHRLQWGECPRAKPYQLGEEVQWLRSGDGRIAPPFRLIERRWNCGDPAALDVAVKDPQYGGGPLHCASCGAAYAGVIIAIENGRFTGARLYRDGEFDDEVDVFQRAAGGGWIPRTDLYDQPIFPGEPKA